MDHKYVIARLCLLTVVITNLQGCSSLQRTESFTLSADENALLLAAIQAGEVKRVERFLDRTGNPNQRLEVGYEWGYPKVVGSNQSLTGPPIPIIVRENVRVLKRYPTVLEEAVREERTDIVRLLVERGADVNMTNRGKTMPLMYAALCSKPEIVQILLENGANVNAENSAGETVLMLAHRGGRTQSIELIEEALRKHHDK